MGWRSLLKHHSICGQPGRCARQHRDLFCICAASPGWRYLLKNGSNITECIGRLESRQGGHRKCSYLVDGVYTPCVEEDALREGGLAGVNVR